MVVSVGWCWGLWWWLQSLVVVFGRGGIDWEVVKTLQYRVPLLWYLVRPYPMVIMSVGTKVNHLGLIKHFLGPFFLKFRPLPFQPFTIQGKSILNNDKGIEFNLVLLLLE